MSEQPLRSVVTGAASGIGAAVAALLRSRGHRVAGIDRDPAPGCVVADLADRDARAVGLAAAVEQLGGVDVLVNVAGIFVEGAVHDSGPQDWSSVWAVNLEAPLDLMHHVAPRMIRQRFGRIVSVTSVHARAAQHACLAYDVSKAGLEAGTRSAALDLARHGVLVNAVAPGFVRTRMSLRPDGTDETEDPHFQAVYVTGGKLPVGRPATPEEVAPAVEFLASRSNTYITGQVLTVDGGLTTTF